MVSGGDFARKTPKSAAWRSIRIQGFRARGPFGTEMPAGCPRIPRKRQQNKAFWAPRFPLFQESMRKTYIIVYVFWYFWSPFPWISCHTSKTIDSDRTGRRGFDAILATFPRPEKQPIHSYVYVGILRWFSKNNRISRNELNPPSAVRPHLEAFHVFQLRDLIGIPA